MTIVKTNHQHLEYSSQSPLYTYPTLSEHRDSDLRQFVVDFWNTAKVNIDGNTTQRGRHLEKNGTSPASSNGVTKVNSSLLFV